MRSHLSTALEITGYAIVTYGGWLMYAPLGIVLAGGFMVAVAYGLGGKR